jgi:8-amino-7-oxononanoate synthase
MIPPATPSGLNIVRISLSAAHSDEDLGHIIAALEKLSLQQPQAPSAAA